MNTEQYLHQKAEAELKSHFPKAPEGWCGGIAYDVVDSVIIYHTKKYGKKMMKKLNKELKLHFSSDTELSPTINTLIDEMLQAVIDFSANVKQTLVAPVEETPTKEKGKKGKAKVFPEGGNQEKISAILKQVDLKFAEGITATPGETINIGIHQSWKTLNFLGNVLIIPNWVKYVSYASTGERVDGVPTSGLMFYREAPNFGDDGTPEGEPASETLNHMYVDSMGNIEHWHTLTKVDED